MSETLPIPSHVPPHLVRHIDPYHIEGGETDPFLAWHKIQSETPDIYFTPYYGGYWVLNRAALIDQVLAAPERFQSRGGATVPAMPDDFPPLPPVMTDPPEHAFFRKPLALALGPQRLQSIAVRAREIVTELIDGFHAKGECEFVQDFAMRLPVAILMFLMDLPFSDSAMLIPFADAVTHSSDMAKRAQAIQEMMAYADQRVRERRENPGDDLVSQFSKMKIGDRPITHTEAVGMMALLLFGGLDSVSHSMCAVMRFLAENPGHRQQLVDNPDLIPNAMEELLRRHSVLLTARKVKEDLELGGIQMKAGDHVFVAPWLAGMDPQAWENPMEVDFNRCPRDIMTFGKGIHKCLGVNLARVEIRIMLQEWLTRMPDFSIKQGEKPVTMAGQSLGTVYLPLSWPVA